MWEQMKIGESTVEFDAEKTRNLYSTIDGGIAHCECPNCANYRLVREATYPLEFRALLERLGIDHHKEIELTHYSGDDESVHVGHPAGGHYAFVGHVLNGPQGAHEPTNAFEFWVDGDAHPSTRATFGRDAPVIDLHFFVAEISEARTGVTP